VCRGILRGHSGPGLHRLRPQRPQHRQRAWSAFVFCSTCQRARRRRRADPRSGQRAGRFLFGGAGIADNARRGRACRGSLGFWCRSRSDPV